MSKMLVFEKQLPGGKTHEVLRKESVNPDHMARSGYYHKGKTADELKAEKKEEPKTEKPTEKPFKEMDKGLEKHEEQDKQAQEKANPKP